MIDNYIEVLNREYKSGTNNHPEHNGNPSYWSVLLHDVISNREAWEGKTALDFGCGKGRNLTNLLSIGNFKRLDGVDISQANIDYCMITYTTQPFKFYKNNGKDLSQLQSDEYDFVMSTIVFQHIPVYDLRVMLMKEIYRVMKIGGIFSFQMGYGPASFKGRTIDHSYYANDYDVSGSNGSNDVRVTDEDQLRKDLELIGFKNIDFHIEPSWADGGHPSWIYTRCEKI